MFFRTPFNYDADAASNESGLSCADESLAVQSAKDETDINTIVRRFGLTGELPGDFQMPQSVDVAGMPSSYHAAMNYVLASQAEFMRMPGELRERFNNDPGQLLGFLDDPSKVEESVSLGLRVKREVPVAPAAAAADSGVSGRSPDVAP